MPIRPLDILDIPLIARYRNDTLTLDSTRALTRGHPLGVAGLLAYFNPTRHMYAAVANGNGTSLLGGVIHSYGEAFAKLLYLAPASKLDHAALPGLVEHLVVQVGEWGAFHVIAEIDETSDAFPALRRAGFSVYAWQRMWDVSELKGDSNISKGWTRARSVNRPALQSSVSSDCSTTDASGGAVIEKYAWIDLRWGCQMLCQPGIGSARDRDDATDPP